MNGSFGKQMSEQPDQQLALFLQSLSHFLCVCFPSSETSRSGDGMCRLLFVKGVVRKGELPFAPFPLTLWVCAYVRACVHACFSWKGMNHFTQGWREHQASICCATYQFQDPEKVCTSICTWMCRWMCTGSVMNLTLELHSTQFCENLWFVCVFLSLRPEKHTLLTHPELAKTPKYF